MFRKLIATPALWLTIPLRLALGIIFIAHGGGKMFGWFGGRGLSAFMGGTPPFAFMRPAWLWLGAAAFAEFFGGVLVLAGLLTRVGAFFIVCV
ncbi:MAG TPA: DoxX family protein, partial [Pyrinomonadaceae bacterium]